MAILGAVIPGYVQEGWVDPQRMKLGNGGAVHSGGRVAVEGVTEKSKNPQERDRSNVGKEESFENLASTDGMVPYIRSFVNDAKEFAENDLVDLYERWSFFETLVDGDSPSRYYFGDVDVDSQLSYRIVRTIVARMKRDFWGSDQILYMDAQRQEDKDYEEKATASMTTIVRDAGMVEEGGQSLDDCVTLGTGALYWRYKRKTTKGTGKGVRHVLRRNDRGQMVRDRVKRGGGKRSVTTDHLIAECVSPYDLIFPPDSRSPVNGDWLIHLQYWDEDEVLARFDSGEWVNWSQVEAMAHEGRRQFLGESDRHHTGTAYGAKGGQSFAARQRRLYRMGVNASPWDTRAGINKFLVEFVWARLTLVPDGRPQECLAILVNGVPVYVAPNHLVGEYRPYAIARYEVLPRMAHGRGAVEPIAAWHLMINGFLQQGADAGFWESNPMGFYRESSSLSEQEFSPHPGLMIPVEDPQKDVNFFSPDMGASEKAVGYYSMLREEGFAIPGANEAIRGGMTDRDVGATQYEGNMANAVARLWEPTENIERELCVASYTIAHKLVMQFFSYEMLVRIGGEDDFAFEWIYPDEAVVGFRVRGLGTMAMQEKQQRSREMLNQFSVLSSAAANGQVEDVRFREGFRRLLKILDMPEVDTIIPPERKLKPRSPSDEELRWTYGTVPGVHDREDYSQHLHSHLLFVKTAAFRALAPSVQDDVWKHVDETEAALSAMEQEFARKQAEAMSGQPPQQGPAGGQAPPGGGGPGVPSPADLGQMAAAGQGSGSMASMGAPGQASSQQGLPATGGRGAF